MSLALHNLSAMNGGRLPAAIRNGGKALLSWRVGILPFLEQFARLLREVPPRRSLGQPSQHGAAERDAPRLRAGRPQGHAAVLHLLSRVRRSRSGTLFDGEEGTKIADFIYMARPTLMVVEAAHPVPWTKPEDVPYDKGEPLPKLGGQFDDGFYAAFADGSVRFIGREVAPERIHAAVTGRTARK